MYNLFSDLKIIPNDAGIYKITINNNCYIGSSFNIKNRLGEHKSLLTRNKHYATYLQNSFNKYGKNNLYVEIIFTFIDFPSKTELLKKEEEFIKKFNPKFNSKLEPTTEYNSITQSKPCYQYDLQGKYLNSFLSTRDVKRKLNIDCANACRGGKYKSSGGFIWSYIKYDVFPTLYVNNSNISKIKNITCYDITGNKIETYNSIAECSKKLFGELNFTNNCAIISSCATEKQISFNGYRFSYENLNQLDNSKLKKFKKGYPIIQLDANLNVIKIWNNNSQAEQELNLKVQLSTYVDKNKKHKGFYWKRL